MLGSSSGELEKGESPEGNRAYKERFTRRMKPGAPATVPHAVVLLRQMDEGIPGRGIEWLDRIPTHGASLAASGHLTDEGSEDPLINSHWWQLLLP
jgi:hypothetical protein